MTPFYILLLLAVSAGARPTRRCAPSTNATTTHGGVAPPAPSPGAPGTSQPRFVVYADEWLNPFPSPEDLKGWNVFNLAFFAGYHGNTSQTGVDDAQAWMSLDAGKRAEIKKSYNDNGISLMVSVFGADGVLPVTQGIDPTQLAATTAKFVKDFDLDGADIDYEEFDVFSSDGDKSITWLVTYTHALRQQLPSPQYLISHAPVAPWFSTSDQFSGGYVEVDKQVGSDIDWYNVQFYNQDGDYEDCSTLFDKSSQHPGTSIFEIHSKTGIPLDKLVVGKPASSTDASTGYIAPAELGKCVQAAVAKGWNGGIMSWEWPRADAAWIAAAKGGAFD